MTAVDAEAAQAELLESMLLNSTVTPEALELVARKKREWSSPALTDT